VLLDVAMAGPLWGCAASGALLLGGLGLSAAGLGDVTIDSPALADSFIVGLLGQAVLGEALVNPEVRIQRGRRLFVEPPLCVRQQPFSTGRQPSPHHTTPHHINTTPHHTHVPRRAQVQVSSLFVAGWGGLVANALNLLPTGELDGGRMALGLWGRRWVKRSGRWLLPVLLPAASCTSA
jgi:hypothetical protein